MADLYEKEKINDAIKLLRKSGYIVTKLTKAQENDVKDCEACGWEGECFDCACSVCIAQQ